MNISAAYIDLIRGCPKTLKVRHGSVAPVVQKQSKQWGFDLTTDQDELSDISLSIFVRQNMFDSENFTCGVLMDHPDGKKIKLSRYNGSDHQNDVAVYQCHIHHSTPESINRGDRCPEHADTKVTDRYTDLRGAFECLRDDYNIAIPDDIKFSYSGF